MNRTLEKRERVITGCKERGELRSEIERSLGLLHMHLPRKTFKKYMESLVDGSWKVEALLVVSGLGVDGSTETYLVNMYDIMDSDMGKEMGQVNRTEW